MSSSGRTAGINSVEVTESMRLFFARASHLTLSISLWERSACDLNLSAWPSTCAQ